MRRAMMTAAIGAAMLMTGAGAAAAPKVALTFETDGLWYACQVHNPLPHPCTLFGAADEAAALQKIEAERLPYAGTHGYCRFFGEVQSEEGMFLLTWARNSKTAPPPCWHHDK